jgi:hypothetical protein
LVTGIKGQAVVSKKVTGVAHKIGRLCGVVALGGVAAGLLCALGGVAHASTALAGSGPVAFVTNQSGAGCGASPGSQQIRRFNLATKKWLTPIIVPFCTWEVDVAPNGTTAVGLGYTLSYSISVFNRDTGKVGPAVTLPLPPTYVAFARNSKTAYVLGEAPANQASVIYAVDLSTGHILKTYTTGDDPVGIVTGDKGTRLLVSYYADDKVQTLALPGMNVLRSQDGLPGDAGSSETISPSTTTDWIDNYFFGTGNGVDLDPVDVATGDVGPSVFVAGDGGQLLVTPSGTTGIVPSSYDGAVRVVDLTTGRLERTIAVTFSGSAFLDTNGTTGYVAASRGHKLVPIDYASGTVGRPIQVTGGDSLYGVAGIYPVGS